MLSRSINRVASSRQLNARPLGGVWGGLCIFDYACYTQQGVPAFRSEEQHPLIQKTLALRQREHPQRSSALQGLAQLVTYCDALLTTCALGRHFSVCDGVLMPHAHHEQRCADRWEYEDVADLFERVLTRYTISYYTVLGLSFTALLSLGDRAGRVRICDTPNYLITNKCPPADYSLPAPLPCTISSTHSRSAASSSGGGAL